MNRLKAAVWRPDAECAIISTYVCPARVITTPGLWSNLLGRFDVTSIPRIAGIYQIRCLATDKVYVGSAVNLYQRYHQHWSDLRLNRHRNPYLQRAWNKYGGEAFAFDVLEHVEVKTHLLQREQWYLDERQAYDRNRGFNINRNATSRLGMKVDPAVVRRIADKIRGRTLSPEHRERIRQGNLGKTVTWGDKIAEAKRGKPRDEATRAKLSAANSGKKHPPEYYRNHVREYIVTDPDGNEYRVINLSAFEREHGFVEDALRRVATGKRKQCRGWRCRRADL